MTNWTDIITSATEFTPVSTKKMTNGIVRLYGTWTEGDDGVYGYYDVPINGFVTTETNINTNNTTEG